MNENEYELAQPKQPKEHPLGKAVAFSSEGEIVSRIYSDEWDFIGTEARPKGKNAKVSFKKTNPEHKKAIQDTLSEVASKHKDATSQNPTASMLKSWRDGLRHIATALGSTEWAVIDTQYGFRAFKAQLKAAKLGTGVVEGLIVLVLNRLHEINVIQRVIDGRELIALAKVKKRKQAIAIPVGMYQRLLSQVILTVETYHPYRHEIARVMGEVCDIQARVNNGENVLAGYKGAKPDTGVLSMDRAAVYARVKGACDKLIKHSIPDFDIDSTGFQLGKIQTACAMVLGGFSGVRIGEMLSFDKDSYDTTTGDKGKEISVLKGETSKGEDGKPTRTTWQSHPVTKDALELVYDMTEPLRDGYKVKIESLLESGDLSKDGAAKALDEVGSAFIPLLPSNQSATFVVTGMARKFDNLLKQFDIRATEEDVEEFNLLNPSWEGALKVGGYLPKLTPHDFRRTFAVFFKRYNFGNASGIKFQYKHKNINMSEYYANNADLMRMKDVFLDDDLLERMYEEGINLGVDVYDDIYNGSETLSGEGGVRIATEDKFKKAKAGHEVYLSRNEIEALVRNGSIAAVLLPTGGYCTNGECERICGMGLFIGEKKKCIHKVNTDKTAKEVRKQHKRLVGTFRDLNTGDIMRNSILVGMKQKIKELEITLVTHKIKHDAFEDKVKGLINE